VLRQLARLTRPIDKVPGAVALAVYADGSNVPGPAAERGPEGVACVDDAARALTLLWDVHAATRLPVIEAWATAVLRFVLYMQDPEGRFVNFVGDWSGTRNERGQTSQAGGSFWQARGVRGLASAWIACGDPRAASGVQRGMTHVRADPAAASVRAIHILTAVDLLRAGRMPELRAEVSAWSDELVACRRDGVLFDDPDETEPHLWAHLQEGALAVAGAYLGRDDLVQVARQSAMRYLAPLIESGFDLPLIQPDGVACALFGVDRLAAVTGERRFAQLAERARAWFHERNTARRVVYDRVAGRVSDGIDGGVLNAHSGAESNIAGAQALFPELATSAVVHLAAIERALPPLLTRGAAPVL
jgi:hypothetical protein